MVRTAPTLLNGVVTNRFRNDDGQGNYQFGYDWTHPGGEGVFQRESGDSAGRKQGSYGLKDADGRVRVVSYIADENGFRVSVSTNEPGTRPSAPADVRFQLPDAQLTSTAFQSQAPAFQNPAPTFPSQASTFQNRAPTFQRRAPIGESESRTIFRASACSLLAANRSTSTLRTAGGVSAFELKKKLE
ncbi:hypothetical protein HPB47_004122, partial [Ixodes persulcatus]